MARALELRAAPCTALQVPHGLWLRDNLTLLQVGAAPGWGRGQRRLHSRRAGRLTATFRPLAPQDRPPIKQDLTTWDDHHCGTLYVPQVLSAEGVSVPGFMFNISAA